MDVKKKNLLHSIWLWSLGLFLLSHSIHPVIQAYMLIPLFLSTIAYVYKEFPWFKRKINNPLVICLSALFMIMVLGLLQSLDLMNGLVLVSRNLSLVAMPFFILPILKTTPKERRQLFYVFQGGIIISGVLFLSYACYNSWLAGSTSRLNNDPHFSYNYFMSHMLTDPFGIHPIYHSFLVTLGAASLLTYASKGWKSFTSTSKSTVILILVYYLLLIYLLKSAIFSVLFVASVLFCLIFLAHRLLLKSFKTKVAAVLVFSIIAMIGVTNTYTKMESFETSYDLTNQHQSNLKIRLGIWDCAWPLLKENWLFGVGTGNLQPQLNQEFKEREFKFVLMSGREFNAHNQYLQYGITYGLIAPILLLGILISIIAMGWKNKNPFAIIFAVCFMVFSITESTLEIQRGILLFTGFVSILFYKPDFWKFELSEGRNHN